MIGHGDTNTSLAIISPSPVHEQLGEQLPRLRWRSIWEEQLGMHHSWGSRLRGRAAAAHMPCTPACQNMAHDPQPIMCQTDADLLPASAGPRAHSRACAVSREQTGYRANRSAPAPTWRWAQRALGPRGIQESSHVCCNNRTKQRQAGAHLLPHGSVHVVALALDDPHLQQVLCIEWV